MAGQAVEGWVASVVRRKGQRAERYYVVIAKADTALSALRTFLKLPVNAVVVLRDKLSAMDLRSLQLRPGQIIKT